MKVEKGTSQLGVAQLCNEVPVWQFYYVIADPKEVEKHS